VAFLLKKHHKAKRESLVKQEFHAEAGGAASSGRDAVSTNLCA
jgi:hypothetical protein